MIVPCSASQAAEASAPSNQSARSIADGEAPVESIFLLLAYLAMGRVPSLEQLRYHSPGEWGKLLGLDRIPEVKTLRAKIAVIGDDEGRTARWSGDLAKDWMAHDVEAAGVLLIDGHVRRRQHAEQQAGRVFSSWELGLELIVA